MTWSIVGQFGLLPPLYHQCENVFCTWPRYSRRSRPHSFFLRLYGADRSSTLDLLTRLRHANVADDLRDPAADEMLDQLIHLHTHTLA